ncbi:MAG TPA: DNA-3-methyladenine glycosylase I [Geobacteraceae bacterium]
MTNAQAFLKVREEFGTFDAYMWGFVDGRPIRNAWKNMAEIPASTPLADALSKDLKRRGFRFVGSTIYAGGRDGQRSCRGLFSLAGGEL